MTSEPMPWLKLRLTYLDNAELGSMPAETQLIFYKLLMLAAQCCADGIITMEDPAICWKLHISQDTLNNSLADLAKIRLYKNNGRGHEIIPFLSDGNISTREREQTRERVKKFRAKHSHISNHTSNNISNADVTHRESESESEVEVEVESVSLSRSKKQKIADRLTDSLSLNLLFKTFRLPNKFIKQLKAKGVQVSDLIAEFIRVSGKQNVENPGIITIMNLLRGEIPPDKFYDLPSWRKSLPEDIAAQLGLDSIIQNGYTNGELSDFINH